MFLVAISVLRDGLDVTAGNYLRLLNVAGLSLGIFLCIKLLFYCYSCDAAMGETTAISGCKFENFVYRRGSV